MKAVEELLREKNTHLRAVEQETQSLRTKSVHATQAANTLLRRARLKTAVLVGTGMLCTVLVGYNGCFCLIQYNTA